MLKGYGMNVIISSSLRSQMQGASKKDGHSRCRWISITNSMQQISLKHAPSIQWDMSKPRCRLLVVVAIKLATTHSGHDDPCAHQKGKVVQRGGQ